MLKQKRVLKLCLGLFALGITVSFSNLYKQDNFSNIVKAMEDVPVSGLEIYKQSKENFKGVNGCYIRYPLENSVWPGDSVWPGGYRYFYLDFSAFNSNEQKKRLEDLREQGCYVFGEVTTPGNVDVNVLIMEEDSYVEGYFLMKYIECESKVYDFLEKIETCFVKWKEDIIKNLLNEVRSLLKPGDGKLFKYNELVNSLSADVNGKRCYDFRNVENNKKLYSEIVKLVDYLSDLELRLKSALIAKGMWYCTGFKDINFEMLEDNFSFAREFFQIWIKHLAGIGAFLERFFGLGNKFYQKENDKHAKYKYYDNEVINNKFTFKAIFEKFSWQTKPDCEQIDINISYDDKYKELLLEIVDRDKEKHLFSYRIPVNKDVGSNVFNFLVAVKKAKAKYLLEQNPKLAEKKDELISLIDRAVVVKDNSNKLDINNIHMDREVLGQIIDDAISEKKEIAKIEDIVHHVIYKEIGKTSQEIKDKIIKEYGQISYYSELKDRSSGVLSRLAYKFPTKLLEDIYKNICIECKKQNIDEIKLEELAGQVYYGNDFGVKMWNLVRDALRHEIEVSIVNINL